MRSVPWDCGLSRNRMRPVPSRDSRREAKKRCAGGAQVEMELRAGLPIRRLGLRLVESSLVLATVLVGVALAVEGDVVFKRSGGPGNNPLAVFPHWAHRVRYKCYACHPAPFRMAAGANPVSMELIQQGKSCGVCHNGKKAWGVTFDTCNRCHTGQ